MRARETIKRRRRRADLAARFFLLILTAGACATLGLIVFLNGATAADDLGPPAPGLDPVEQAVLTTYLWAKAAELTAPAGPDATPITFSVEQGETAAAVGERLAAQGLVRDARLLDFYLRYKGWDASIEAGDFILRRTMTVPEVARSLTDASAREVIVRITEGWRLEQMAEALSAHADLAVSREEFLALAGASGPRGGTGFVGAIPPGASLEGFLFPDTYLLHPGATASDVINKMLANFKAKLPADYDARVMARGLTLYQAVTFASLIEREAVVDDERPRIASVIYNRLALGQALEIDATVQYALATPENWWPPVTGLDLRAVDSPYNTYVVTGLPAGPIASPSLKSILAVADPADTPYLFYRALCDGSGRHAFAATYAEHLANACP
jgi:UPF0755 protein